MGRGINYIWMAVTPDEYELPICVAETAELLGHYMGVSKQAIIMRANRGGGIAKDSRILKIELLKERGDDYEARINQSFNMGSKQIIRDGGV